MTDVRFPEMRLGIVAALEILADTDLQHRVWTRGLRDPNRIQDFDVVVSTLLDDSDADTLTERDVGAMLRDMDEVKAVRRVGLMLARLLEERGTQLSDAEYASLPEWPLVVAAARQALVVLSGRGDRRRHDFEA